MGKLKLKSGDQVIVIAGGSKDKSGVIISVLPTENRAIVEGVNMIKKHTKPNAQNPQGGIVEKEASIHISNLALIDSSTGKPTRIGYKIDGDKKTRISIKSGKTI